MVTYGPPATSMNDRQPVSQPALERLAQPRTGHAPEPPPMVGMISPNDEMFDGDIVHYDAVGRSALQCIERALDAAGMHADQVHQILDFPCGHGRVNRLLRARFPSATIVACDLNRDGVDWCARTYGSEPMYSHDNPARIRLTSGRFDLIWSGSLFTHFDAPRWYPFLALFRRALRPKGVLVVTTHGQRSIEMLAQPNCYGLSGQVSATLVAAFEASGFGYASYDTSPGYGHSVSSRDWVLRECARVAGLQVRSVAEGAWDEHQDVYACVATDAKRNLWERLGAARRRLWSSP